MAAWCFPRSCTGTCPSGCARCGRRPEALLGPDAEIPEHPPGELAILGLELAMSGYVQGQAVPEARVAGVVADQDRTTVEPDDATVPGDDAVLGVERFSRRLRSRVLGDDTFTVVGGQHAAEIFWLGDQLLGRVADEPFRLGTQVDESGLVWLG